MFTHYRTQGFVLKKTDRGESDRVFTIYTKDFGKLELLAKAERKINSKLRGGLELFYLSDIEFIQGKGYKTLTDVILINDFRSLRKSLKRLAVAFKMSDVLDELIKLEESDEKIWQLLYEAFETLNNWKIENWKLKIIYYYFLWHLLSVLGYQPELYSCTVCQKKLAPGNIFFNFKEGGLVCGDCREAVKKTKEITAEAVKITRIIIGKDWQTLKRLKIEEDDLKQLRVFSDYYLSGILRQME